MAVLSACTAAGWLSAASALQTPAQKCQAGKNAAAGRYAQCRETAQKNFILYGNATKYATAIGKCEAKQAKTWTTLESRYGAACPTNGDQAGIQTDVTNFMTCLNADLGGTPGACDVTALQTDVNTCNAGTATAGNVLSGKTFSSSAGLGVSGTMPNNGAVTLTPSCTVTSCSCMRSSNHWTSTTYQSIPYHAWILDFHGGVGSDAKSSNDVVRAVRRGL